MEGSSFFRFENRLSSAWSYNNNNASDDQEVDLTLRLGLPDENQEAPTQVVIPQNFSDNINVPRFHHQRMENSGILQNAGEGVLERNRFSGKLNHIKPWPLPVLNMLSNNWNSISGNSSVMKQQQQQQQQQQRKCKICQKTDTPLWRKGPDGPKTLCNGCGLRYAREIKRH